MNFQKRGHNMPDKFRTRERYGEAFWRKHHEAWQQSALNQREYCEAQGIPLKAFGNWRAKFKAQPRPPVPMLLYWRGGLSHALSQGLSHDFRALLFHLRARGRRRGCGERMNGEYRRKRI